ncbi:MAG: hypothetical protein L0229_10215 [Blastocatellia bacterium]|nr:hypothetical protein [Blastocatellia bacterium]
MWRRTKRLINSYLDDLINRASSPEKDVRAMTRAEIGRLNEIEVQSRASVKVFEKELAEVELKMIGVAERERQAREQGNAPVASTATNNLIALSSQRDLLKKQIADASAAAERARVLREERRQIGEELATETHLTSMRENLAGIQSPFDATDPASTIDEMRARLNRSGTPAVDSRVAEADRELEAERARAAADELLARYKQGISGGASKENTAQSPSAKPSTPSPSSESVEDEGAKSSKSLGRTDGPLRPID